MESNSFATAWALLPEYLSQHVLLSLSALLIGVFLSLPLGFAAARTRQLRGPVLIVANTLQTVPGLAMLALCYPLLLAISSFTLPALGVRIPALGFVPAM